jgi:hypothetical protein
MWHQPYVFITGGHKAGDVDDPTPSPRSQGLVTRDRWLTPTGDEEIETNRYRIVQAPARRDGLFPAALIVRSLPKSAENRPIDADSG